MSTSKLMSFEDQVKQQQLAILKVYNYYRLGLSFLFLFLFINVLDFIREDIGKFVGGTYPDMFLYTIICYLSVNVLISLSTLLLGTNLLSRNYSIFAILLADVIGLTLLIFASGGVSSGLGNFLIFTVSFAGGLVRGKISAVIPAIAFILIVYGEFYLFFVGKNEIQSIFQTGVLGVVCFALNILFQVTSKRLLAREQEVYTLEHINQIVIDSMRTGVLVTSNDGDIQMSNVSAQRMLSIPEKTEAAIKIPSELLSFLQDWNKNQTSNVLKFSVSAASEPLVANLSALSTPKSQSDKLIFVEDSEEIQKQAQQLNLAALGRLSATIAHEIRNPLGAMSHAAQLLSESDELPRGDLRLAEIIQDHCLRVNNVVENVLQLSRRKPPEPKELILAHWLKEFLEEYESILQPKPSIRLKVEPENLSVNFDPLHLSQVLGNLCQNGIRYSEKHSGESQLDISAGIDTATSKPYIDIIDYGRGVDNDQVQNLFEPFFTTEASGTGIGLYLSRELCSSNNAKLTYARAATGGSCFKVVFFDEQRG